MATTKPTDRENQLLQVDWSTLPQPNDDGGASHLEGFDLPAVSLPSTDGTKVDLSALTGTTIVFAYPRTGRPDQDLPEGWDMIPGARGCTPQSCAFRDLNKELMAAGADRVFGLSTQTTAYQLEVVQRMHLPFQMLSDERGNFRKALNLPVMQVNGMTLLKRLTMAIRNGTIVKTWYPVFPPDKNPQHVLSWLVQK